MWYEGFVVVVENFRVKFFKDVIILEGDEFFVSKWKEVE